MHMGDDLQRYIFALAILEEESGAKEALHDWFIDQGVDEFAAAGYLKNMERGAKYWCESWKVTYRKSILAEKKLREGQ